VEGRPFVCGDGADAARLGSSTVRKSTPKGIAHMCQRLLVLLAVSVLLPTVAMAKLCGDDVAGQDISCACGDTVVSDVQLTNDPVAREECPADGLIVRAIDSPHAVTIDLAGKTLHGSGHGVGVLILDGGPGGAHLISSAGAATIEGFRDGIVARGARSVALIDRLTVVKSKQDGVRIEARGYKVQATEVRDSGRHGFSLGGNGFRVTNTRALNSRQFGYTVTGQNGTVGLPGAGNTATGNGAAGFHLMGRGHSLVEGVAEDGKDGIRLNVSHASITRCRVESNQRDGLSGKANDSSLTGNRATGNGNNGIALRGQRNRDGGGNAGSANRGKPRRRPAAQCTINGQDCLP
jgi:hypothetical protein